MVCRHASLGLLMLGLGCYPSLGWTLDVSTMGSTSSSVPVSMRTESAKRVPMSTTSSKPWRSMTAQERADAWPHLDEVSRRLNWQSMTPSERKALRSLMSSEDIQALRRRYTLPEQVKRRLELEEAPVPAAMLDQHDRAVLRRQIIEVHIQIRASEARPTP